MTLTDTHCHLDAQKFDVDRELVIRRAVDAGIRRMLVPSLDHASALRATALAQDHPELFVAVGFHPTEIESFGASDIDEMRRLAALPKVVAIGEIGLDYFWVRDTAARAHQRTALQKQLELARQIDRPVILHLREEQDADSGDCATDLISILSAWVGQLRLADSGLAVRPGVLHSFAGSLDTAHRAIDLGFYIGVTGPITYRNAQQRRNLIAALPLERLLIETDSPYLAPEPHRGQRNEPAFVAHIADRIAQVHSCTAREVAEVTSANAARLFAWGEVV